MVRGKKIGSSEVETMLTGQHGTTRPEKVWLSQAMSEWKDKHLWKDQYMSSRK